MRKLHMAIWLMNLHVDIRGLKPFAQADAQYVLLN